jgi:hypothetical protein
MPIDPKIEELRRLREGGDPVIWIHAVSVGEARAAQPLVRCLETEVPAAHLGISTTTATGQAVAGPEEYASAVKPHLEKLGGEVIIEPGRYVSGPSGLLLTSVLYRKESEHGRRRSPCHSLSPIRSGHRDLSCGHILLDLRPHDPTQDFLDPVAHLRSASGQGRWTQVHRRGVVPH